MLKWNVTAGVIGEPGKNPAWIRLRAILLLVQVQYWKQCCRAPDLELLKVHGNHNYWVTHRKTQLSSPCGTLWEMNTGDSYFQPYFQVWSCSATLAEAPQWVYLMLSVLLHLDRPPRHYIGHLVASGAKLMLFHTDSHFWCGPALQWKWEEHPGREF